MKDSFDASSLIQSIPHILFEHSYVFVIFGFISFFTNIPLDRTIKIILKRIYEYKLIAITLKKSIMKKLITDVYN